MRPAHRRLVAILAALLAVCVAPPLHAHGGVVAEDDLCIINIGYLEAHFKIYVPPVTGHRDYCEDIPVRGESLFVMEYLHDGLSSVPVEFRIIRNTTGKGTFARLADVQSLPDLDAVTVRHEPPAIVPDVYTLLHEFADDGEYIGIVTAGAAGEAKRYTAVFPFAVGARGAGIWPWIIAALVLAQWQFWYWWRRRPSRPATALACLLCLAWLLPAAASDAGSGPVAGESGHFEVRYTPALAPLVINEMHSWTIRVRDADGQPVAAARIDVDGGMPEHDHGLPTTPRAVATGDPGEYRIDGLRFHMPGDWFLLLTIDDGERRDRVIIRFRLQ